MDSLLAFTISNVLNYLPASFSKYVFKYVFLLFLFFVFLPTPVSAAKPNVSGVPGTIDVTQSFQVNVTLTIANSAGNNYYLRAAFSQPNTTQYFGYTKNHFDSWYNGSPSPIDPFQFKKITMDAYNTWSGVVEVKLDPESSYYKGAGNHVFKLGYYRESGGSVADWSDAVQLAITGGSPSPTPTPSPSPSLSPSPSPTPDTSPMPTPAPSPSPTSVSSPKSTPTPSPKVLGAAKTAIPTPPPAGGPTSTPKEDKLVLGQTTQASPSPEAKSASRFAGSSFLAFGLMGLGLVLIIFSAYTFLKPRSSGTMTLDNE